jgi:YesN/AraC family two-component response regulator
MKVMVVDDERDVEFLFRQRFRKEIREGTIEFFFAFSGDEALAYLRSLAAPDVVLVLSDINMPGMTGLELLKLVKEDFSHLRVCMITAYSDETNYKTAMQFGAEEYLTKPLDFDKLKKEVLAL